MKKPYRRHQYLTTKKALDKENRKLITEQYDIEQLELITEKFEWYAKNWLINLTPTYYWRWRRFKLIVKKYNLDIDICEFKQEGDKK